LGEEQEETENYLLVGFCGVGDGRGRGTAVTGALAAGSSAPVRVRRGRDGGDKSGSFRRP